MQSQMVTAYGEPLRPVEAATPDPEGREVLVRVRASGVCHTDVHVWDGYYDLGGGRQMRFADRGLVPPFTLGHEIAGEVAAAGPDADIATGTPVLVYPWIGCGACARCEAGEGHLCATPRYLGIFRPGGYADHVLVPDVRYLVPLDGIDARQAAPLACSGLTAYSALAKIGLDRLRAEPIGIVGAGGLGLMALSILKALGGRGAVVVDLAEANRRAALDAGALAVVDGAAPAALDEAKAASGGPVSAVIDFVGAPATVQLGIDWVGKGGTVVVIGLYGGALSVSLPLLPLRAVGIVGSFVGSLPELQALVRLVRDGKVAPIPIVPCPLHDANDALIALKEGRRVGRTVLEPSG